MPMRGPYLNAACGEERLKTPLPSKHHKKYKDGFVKSSSWQQ